MGRLKFPSISVTVPPEPSFSLTVTPIIGSSFLSTTLPETFFFLSCSGDKMSVDRIIFLSNTEYLTSVPAKTSFKTWKILLLIADTETRRSRLTCLLLKKKSKSDWDSISFKTSPTVWLRTSILIIACCAYTSVAHVMLTEQMRQIINSFIDSGICFKVIQNEFIIRNNWMLQ